MGATVEHRLRMRCVQTQPVMGVEGRGAPPAMPTFRQCGLQLTVGGGLGLTSNDAGLRHHASSTCARRSLVLQGLPSTQDGRLQCTPR
jgi:hypothetical protein